MAKCKTCNGTGEYRSGCHVLPCPACLGVDTYLRITEEELARLVLEVGHVDVSFGSGGLALRCPAGEALPAAVYRLAELRGVTTQNMDGMGI